MMELDKEKEADSRVEDNDVTLEVITMVKDDMLLVVQKEDDGRVSQEDFNTTVMMEEVGDLEMVQCTDSAHTIAWTRHEVCTL